MSSTAQILKQSRTWHRKVASALFIFFFAISITGILLGWKNIFGANVYSSNIKQKTPQSMNDWLPLDSLKNMATTSFISKLPNETNAKVESINARIDNGSVRFTFSNGYNVQLNAQNGVLQAIDKKAPGWIIKLHDGELLDDLFNIKNGGFKKTYASIMGLALFFLTLSGFWMWFKPKQLRNAKKEAIAETNENSN